MTLADRGIADIDDSQLDAWLANLSGPLERLVQVIETQRPTDAYIELPARTVLLRHEPDRAPLAFAFRFFEGLSAPVIDRYEALHGVDLPPPLKQMLKQMNGAYFLELSLYGIPLSMTKDPPLLSRLGLNPLDIATGAKCYRVGYQVADTEEFMFGVRNTGWTTQVGYFMRADGSVARYPRVGNVGEVRRWPSLEAFFTEELEETIRLRLNWTQKLKITTRKNSLENVVRSLRRCLDLG
jgi:hypothetical protein